MHTRLLKKSFTGGTVLLLCLLFVLTIVLAGCSDKGDSFVENLNIDLTLNEDGSVIVTETHKVRFDDRGRDWWNYYKRISLNDTSNGNTGTTVSQFGDFKVTVNGIRYSYDADFNMNPDNFSSSQIQRLAGSAYTYFGSGNTVEIGVVFPYFSEGTRTVTFEYTLTNVAIRYADCSGLYYKFVDESNTLFVEEIAATVNFPEVNADDISVWTHIEDGNGSGIIPEGESANKVVYRANELNKGVYFETRLLLPSSVVTSEKTNSATKAQITAEETAWQEAFNAELRKIRIMYISDIVLAVLLFVGGIAFTVYVRIKRRKLVLPNAPVYYREIPEGWTPGEMAPLYHYYGKYDISDGISATILDLCRRHFIDIEAGEKKKEAEITVRDLDTTGLAPHEKIVFELLQTVGQGKPFTMKQMERYAKSNSNYFAAQVKKFREASYGMGKGMNLYPDKRSDKYGRRAEKAFSISLIAGIGILFFTFIFNIFKLYFPYTGLALILSAIIEAVSVKTQKAPLPVQGQEVYDKFRALGKFMTEFGNMDRHELPQLVLWEEYMVYATAMGIADKVAEQLEIAYPEYKEITSRGYSSSSDTFLILYLLSPSVRLGTNFALASSISGIIRNVNAVRRNAALMSVSRTIGSRIGGSRGGGGFRGGGGGFGGGGMGSR